MSDQSDLTAVPLTGETLHALARPAAGGPRRPSPRRISARAAFQEVLAGHALLLDLRSPHERETDGQVGGSLPVLAWAGASLEALTDVVVPGTRLVLLGDGNLLRAGLRAHGYGDVVSIEGGFGAWRAAGMPVAA